MKTRALVFLLAALLIGCLSGCTKDKPEEPTSPTLEVIEPETSETIVDINNSNCYYTSAFKGGASSGGPGQSVSSQAVEDSTQPQSNGQSGSSNKGGSSKFSNTEKYGVDEKVAAEIAAGMRGGDYN